MLLPNVCYYNILFQTFCIYIFLTACARVSLTVCLGIKLLGHQMYVSSTLTNAVNFPPKCCVNWPSRQQWMRVPLFCIFSTLSSLRLTVANGSFWNAIILLFELPFPWLVVRVNVFSYMYSLFSLLSLFLPYVLSIFLLSDLSYWFVESIYVFWIAVLSLLHELQTYSSWLWLAFSLFNGVIGEQKL